ncbi:BAR domain-containing protein [Basidiobolus ranarum]|uniref:BAR domain-containing protein n=1 Tax=Basidiobolus ranarum TaxID=34480 RepID=A0ABR2WJW5_9FUNG
MDSFSSFSQKLNPLARKLTQGFGQARQLAQERFGGAGEITELPQEYLELEKKVDAIRNVHLNLLKVTRVFMSEDYDYPTQLQESIADVSRTLVKEFKQVALGENEQAGPEPEEAPKTLSHALSRASAQGAEEVGLEEPLGAALFKYSSTQEKLGNERLKMDNDIMKRFIQPFNTTLNTNIQFALKARKRVYATRLNLDAFKNNLKNSKPEKTEAIKLEVEQAEEELHAAVDEAMGLMRSVIETPEPLRNLADLVAAQLAYYKQGFELLSEIAPEIDEMQVTQEALYRNNRE